MQGKYLDLRADESRCSTSACTTRYGLAQDSDRNDIITFCTCQCNVVSLVEDRQKGLLQIAIVLAVMQAGSLLVMLGILQQELAARARRSTADGQAIEP